MSSIYFSLFLFALIQCLSDHDFLRPKTFLMHAVCVQLCLNRLSEPTKIIPNFRDITEMKINWRDSDSDRNR